MSGLRSDNDVIMYRCIPEDNFFPWDFLWKKGERHSRKECRLRWHMHTGRNNLVMRRKINMWFSREAHKAAERPLRRIEGMQRLAEKEWVGWEIWVQILREWKLRGQYCPYNPCRYHFMVIFQLNFLLPQPKVKFYDSKLYFVY